MITNGNATVHVSDLGTAIRFYSETLGLKLTNRFGERWATVETAPSYWTTDAAHAGLIIGLHPPTPGDATASSHVAPGTRGGVGYGLETYRPCEEVIAEFAKRGVRVTSDIIRFDAGNTFMFEDVDGFPSYVHEFPPEMIDDAHRERHANSGAADALISGGHAIVYVSDMDAAIRFYADTLGLTLTNRFENHFATVEAGRRLVIGIHPITPLTPRPGTPGSVTLSLVVDEPINTVLSRLAHRGVRTTGHSGPGTPRAQSEGRSVDIEDPDGNVITLWEVTAVAPERQVAPAEVPVRR
jgi:predicted enzyme related to lactoylglutathione lyase